MLNKMFLSDPQHFKALGHPIRLQILKELEQGPMNLTEIGKKIGHDPASILYHIRQLETADMVRVSRESQIGSIKVKYYEVTAKMFVADTNSAVKADIDNAANLGIDFLNETSYKYRQAIEKNLATAITVEDSLLLNEKRWEHFFAELQELIEKYKTEPDESNTDLKSVTSTIVLIENPSNKQKES